MSGVEKASPSELKKLAWKMCTDRNTQARNGAKALTLIEKVIEIHGEDAEGLMILAAANAQIQEFKTAVDTLKKATLLAKRDRNSSLLAELKQQTVYYKKSRPHPGA